MAFYTTEQRLPALSEVLPADILNSGRFSQFAPYSTGPQVKQEPYEALMKSASPAFYASSPAPSDWSAYSAPSPYSAGERTPSLSPSPSSAHSQLPPSVWVSQTAQQQPAATGAYKELVWMPANMDIPGGSQQQAQRAGPQAAAAAHFRECQRRGMIVECPPARAHGVAHLAPGRQDPDVYMGNDAAAFLSRGIPRIPENQRGKLVFFRYAQAPQKA